MVDTEKNPISNDITFILTIKGREDFTKRAMDYYSSISFPYKILIGDGDKNSKIKTYLDSSRHLDKVDYEYFQFDDATPEHFFRKMQFLLKKVDTPYVMLMDNDDYVLAGNIPTCINFLNENSDYVACGGRIFGFRSIKGKILSEGPMYKPRNYAQSSPLDRSIDYLTHGTLVWYSICKTGVLKKALDNFIETKVKDFLLMENFLAIAVLTQGKAKIFNNFFHYVRQTNTSQCGINIPSFFRRVVIASLGEEIQIFLSSLTNQLVKATSLPAEDVKKLLSDCYASYQEKNHSKVFVFSEQLTIRFYEVINAIRARSIFFNKVMRKIEQFRFKRASRKSGFDKKELNLFIKEYDVVERSITAHNSI